MIELFLLWAIVTLFLGAASGVLGKKYGVGITIGAFVALILTANVIAGKLIEVGPFVVPAAVLAYSSTFLITDILNEKWGKETARKAVWAGFWANIVLVASIYLALQWPAITGSPVSQEAFAGVFGMVPRIVLGSMIAYLVSQHHDVWAFDWWKRRTKGKHLWLRNNASTVVSQAIDSVLFISIAFAFVLPWEIVGTMMLGQWVLKVLIAVVDTPFCYLACNLIDKTK